MVIHPPEPVNIEVICRSASMSCRWNQGACLVGIVGVAMAVLVLPSISDRGESSAVGQILQERTQEPTKTYSPGEIHLKSSRVYTFVGKTGFGHEHGVVGLLKRGSVRLGVEQNGGQLVFDMTSFEADTDGARKYVGLEGSTDRSTQEKVNANMLGSSVLDVQRYPTATFAIKSTRLLPEKSKRGLAQYRLDGDFTLHGVTRPVSIIATAESKGAWIHLRGAFSILQSEYGITPFSKVFGAVGITDQLKIWGDVWIAGAQGVAASDLTGPGK
jgi:hypothetical protein